MCYIYHGEGLLYHGEVSFFYHGFNGFNGLDGFTVRGDCALMRPIGLT